MGKSSIALERESTPIEQSLYESPRDSWCTSHHGNSMHSSLQKVEKQGRRGRGRKTGGDHLDETVDTDDSQIASMWGGCITLTANETLRSNSKSLAQHRICMPDVHVIKSTKNVSSVASVVSLAYQVSEIGRIFFAFLMSSGRPRISCLLTQSDTSFD